MVLKCSFPGFILAPRSSVLKREKKKEYDQWSYTTHLTAFWTFLDRYQNRCSLFHSSISPPSAVLQLCLSEVKEFVLKSEFIENIFVFVLCVEQFVFLECLVLHTGNLSSWDPSRVSRAPDEDLTQGDKISQLERTHAHTVTWGNQSKPTSLLVMLVRVGCMFCWCLYGNRLLDGTFLRKKHQIFN